MPNKKLSTQSTSIPQELIDQLYGLQSKLDRIEFEILSFEKRLRRELGDLIVEAHELTVLYRKIKKQKKEKRLEQKKRGKNYIEPNRVQVLSNPDNEIVNNEDQIEKKRLYREAIFLVHPDKFTKSEGDSDLATKITSRLIDIYKNGSLIELKEYYAHILKSPTIVHQEPAKAQTTIKLDPDKYYKKEKERLQNEIKLAQNQYLYSVLLEYKNPLDYIEELKEYYLDRIHKMKKRTRKAPEK